MRFMVMVVLLCAGAAGCPYSGAYQNCSTGGIVDIEFSPKPQVDTGSSSILLLGLQELDVPCPGEISFGDLGSAGCQSAGFITHVPGLPIESIGQATLTIQAADGHFIADQLVVSLGPTTTEDGGNIGWCTRNGHVAF